VAFPFILCTIIHNCNLGAGPDGCEIRRYGLSSHRVSDQKVHDHLAAWEIRTLRAVREHGYVLTAYFRGCIATPFSASPLGQLLVRVIVARWDSSCAVAFVVIAESHTSYAQDGREDDTVLSIVESCRETRVLPFN
jgi:hypothetical protein